MTLIEAFGRRFPRIHVLGASGSGTTTLGRALAKALNVTHFDTDNFFWLPSDPPFTHKRPIPERRSLIESQMLPASTWVLSGSLCSWGDFLIPDFSLVIRLELDPVLRMERLAQRETQRYGAAIQPGGPMHQIHQAFMDWARQYDQGGPEVRSLSLHKQWTETLPCHVCVLDSSPSPAELLKSLFNLKP